MIAQPAAPEPCNVLTAVLASRMSVVKVCVVPSVKVMVWTPALVRPSVLNVLEPVMVLVAPVRLTML